MIRIATRESPLALWQANHVKSQLEFHFPDLQVTLVPMTTQGDQLLQTSLAEIGGKGLFIKELEQALLAKQADIAVHSMKDVPAEMPDGFQLVAMLPREDPRDALVSQQVSSLSELPQRGRVGTSSLRRRCQIAARYPHLAIQLLRGNVDTRLGKLHSGNFDAIILASAGLHRLGYHHHIRRYLEPEEMLPAIGQGAIGIECRANDPAIEQKVARLNDPLTWQLVTAERALGSRLGASCQIPLGGYACNPEKNQLWLRGVVGDPSGNPLIDGEVRGTLTDAESLGYALAEQLLARGAMPIIEKVLKKL